MILKMACISPYGTFLHERQNVPSQRSQKRSLWLTS